MIEGVGTWVRLHPAAFLTDQYLKYVAWALSDKVRGAGTAGRARGAVVACLGGGVVPGRGPGAGGQALVRKPGRLAQRPAASPGD